MNHGAMRGALLLLAAAAGCAAAEEPDILVVRVGDGAAALSSAATAVFVERHRADGTLTATYALPIVATGFNAPFTLSGGAVSEGAIAVSANGRFVSLAGYATPAGTANVSSSQSVFVNRLVARLDAAGTVDTTTFLGTSAFSGSNVRSAVSVDGTSFWVAGSSSGGSLGGAWFVSYSAGAATAQIASTPANVRTLAIGEGQLFGDSSAKGSPTAFAIGAGLPQAAGQSAASLSGISTTSANGFVVFDRDPAIPGIDTLYLADDRTTATGGGIEKWTFDGAVWTQSARFINNVNAGVRGLAGVVVGAQVVLYATTADAATNVVRMVDDGSASPKGTVIATAPANTVYRGVTLAWSQAPADAIFVSGF